MKNMHVISTDKASSLFVDNDDKKLRLFKEPMISEYSINQNIYITNDEEIKEGDYGILGNDILSYDKMHNLWGMSQGKKIILTTDLELQKDGVQAIDDEFLEWFVKNPSCESADVESYKIDKEWDEKHTQFNTIYPMKIKYKIIIQKDEPEYPIGGYAPGFYTCNCSTCKTKFQGDKRAVQCEPCAKWQADKMFNIMNSYADDVMGGCNLKAKEWFEQFKKK